MRARLLGLMLVAFVAVVAPAWAAYDMTGTWSSASGSTIVIPRGTSNFILLVTHQDGSQYRLKAQWVQGMVGSRFWFVSEYGKTIYATIDPQNVNRVQCNDNVKTWYWTRVAH